MPFGTAEGHGWLMKVSHLRWLKAMNIQEVLTLPSGKKSSRKLEAGKERQEGQVHTITRLVNTEFVETVLKWFH